MTARPSTTDELVQRLDTLSSSPISRQDVQASNEDKALRALCSFMAELFNGDPRAFYTAEAALVSRYIVEPQVSENMIEKFANVITTGLADKTIPDFKMLGRFNELLRNRQSDPAHPLPLGSILQMIEGRIENAKGLKDERLLYVLLRTLSAVLDTMHEVKYAQLSDDRITRLLELLAGACDHDELRLSQVARYTRQALRGIPSDVSPWTKLGNSVLNLTKDIAKAGASVSSMDPAKLIESVEGAFETIPAMITAITDIIDAYNTVVEAVDNFKTVATDVAEVAQGAKNMMKAAYWYVALRFTDLFIRGGKEEELRELLAALKPECKKNEDFLCGLSAQLEQIRHNNFDGSKDAVINVLELYLCNAAAVNKSGRIHKWMAVLELKVERPQSVINNLLDKLPHSKDSKFFDKFRGKVSKWHGDPESFNTTIEYWQNPHEEAGGELLSEAWRKCKETQQFYADQEIRSYYTENLAEKLKIKRLHNEDELPMEQCYINLVMLDDADNSSEENASISGPSQTKEVHVPLTELFRAQETKKPKGGTEFIFN